MGILDTDRTLPTNTLIFEVRRDRKLVDYRNQESGAEKAKP